MVLTNNIQYISQIGDIQTEESVLKLLFSLVDGLEQLDGCQISLTASHTPKFKLRVSLMGSSTQDKRVSIIYEYLKHPTEILTNLESNIYQHKLP